MQKNKLIRHLNKQTNVTYLYWGHSTYVAGLKFPKVEKKCIGKINRKEEFEPNKTFLALSVEQQMETGLVDEPYLSPRLGMFRSMYKNREIQDLKYATTPPILCILISCSEFCQQVFLKMTE